MYKALPQNHQLRPSAPAHRHHSDRSCLQRYRGPRGGRVGLWGEGEGLKGRNTNSHTATKPFIAKGFCALLSGAAGLQSDGSGFFWVPLALIPRRARRDRANRRRTASSAHSLTQRPTYAGTYVTLFDWRWLDCTQVATADPLVTVRRRRRTGSAMAIN